MQVGYGQKSRFWSNSWLSKIAGRVKCQNIYRRRSWVYDTHHWLSIDCWTCELRSDKNSYRRPCSVDRTFGDTPSNVCLWRPAAWTNTPKRREQKRIQLYAVVYLKPKQLIIKDCARRFVLKTYRHEASRGFVATAELLVDVNTDATPLTHCGARNDWQLAPPKF